MNEERLIEAAKAALSVEDWALGSEITVQELTLPDGRLAQIKIVVTTEQDEFDKVWVG